MRQLYNTIREQPFVFATGLAALIHSTWALATLFTGTEPTQFTVNWFAWLIPALLISFSLDVGQIVTSAEIRSGQRTWVKYATFAVFALATYYLQWTYLSAHVPSLPMGEGVSQNWRALATSLRDASIWIVPALLPLSTLLYTFSHTAPASNTDVMRAKSPANRSDTEATQEAPAIAAPKTRATAKGTQRSAASTAEHAVTVTCPDCDWTGSYKSKQAAANALNAHTAHCTKIRTSANGHSQEVVPTS